MKTAMQELFEEFESLSKSSRDAGDTQTSGLIDFLCERKEVALEKEKEQIMNSYVEGRLCSYNDNPSIKANEYYNQTYNN